jgi:hypothetical protein
VSALQTDAVRPLRWWPVAELERLSGAVAQALAAWSQQWGVRDAPTASCVPAAEIGKAALGLWRATADSQVLWAPPTEASFHGAVSDALFGAASEPKATDGGEMALEVASEACTDFWRRLAHLLKVPTLQPLTEAETADTTMADANAWCQAWSGAIVITVRSVDVDLQVLVSATAASRLLSPASGRTARRDDLIVPVWTAISESTTQVHVELRPMELTLGDIAAIRVGDVIAIGQRLDEPLLARSATGVPLFDAFLGKADERRAIEVLARR